MVEVTCVPKEEGTGSFQEPVTVFREPSPIGPPKAQRPGPSIWLLLTLPRPQPYKRQQGLKRPSRGRLSPGRGSGCEAVPEAAPLPLAAWLYIALPLPLLIG